MTSPATTSRMSRLFSGRTWSPDLGKGASRILVFPFAALVAIFVAYPFVRLAQIAFFADGAIDNIRTFLANSANLRVLRTTFVTSAIVTVIAVNWGALLAWSLKVTTKRLFRLLILLAIFVPFWMGSVIKLYAWTVILQTYGMVNNALVALGWIGDTERLRLLYNEFAVVTGMVYQMLPFAVLPLLVAFSTIDLDLVRAAESLGAARLRAIWSVVVPLATPGVLATVMLVFVICTGFFLTPVILGGMTAPFSASLIAQNIFVFFDLPGAVITAMVLVIGAAIVILVGFKAVGAERIRRALG